MRLSKGCLVIALLACPAMATAQTVQVNQQNRTIEIAATSSIQVTADFVTITLILDVAVDAGANYVGDPLWDLADPDAAETQAYASALEKARAIADPMAKSFGAKTGALLYASNEARPSQFGGGIGGGVGGGDFWARKGRTTGPDTKLLPQKIEKTGYVRAIFALE